MKLPMQLPDLSLSGDSLHASAVLCTASVHPPGGLVTCWPRQHCSLWGLHCSLGKSVFSSVPRRETYKVAPRLKGKLRF